MQWDADLPGEALKLEGTGPVAGKAAQAAGKNLTCAPKKTIPGPFKWVCILAGGQKPIGNGVVQYCVWKSKPRRAPVLNP